MPRRSSDPATLGNPANEIGFRIERADVDANGNPGAYAADRNGPGQRDHLHRHHGQPVAAYSYRVVAYNAAGETASNAVTSRRPCRRSRPRPT